MKGEEAQSSRLRHFMATTRQAKLKAESEIKRRLKAEG